MNQKSKVDKTLDTFAAWAAGLTLLFFLSVLFGAVGLIMYIIARLLIALFTM